MSLTNSQILFIKLCLATCASFMLFGALNIIFYCLNIFQPEDPTDSYLLFFSIMFGIGFVGFFLIMFFFNDVEE